MTENTKTDYTSPLKGNGILRCYNMMWRDYEGGFEEMTDRLDHVKDLGMNAVWLNPIADLGQVPKIDFNNSDTEQGILRRGAGSDRASSVYATRHPFMIHPELSTTGYNPRREKHFESKAVGAKETTSEEAFIINKKAVSLFTEKARSLGLTPMFDSAFSHIGRDAPMINGEDPYFKDKVDTSRWFKHYQGGKLHGQPETHGLDENGNFNEFNEDGTPNLKMVWDDVATFDYDNPEIRDEIIKYLWKPFIDAYVEMGFTGLRVDSVAQNHPEVLRPILEHLRTQVHNRWGVPYDEVEVLGETLSVDSEPDDYKKGDVTHVYNSSFWLDVEHSVAGGLNPEEPKTLWQKNDSWINGQMKDLNGVVREADNPTKKGGTVGFPGSHDEPGLAQQFLHDGVTTNAEEYNNGSKSIFLDLKRHQVLDTNAGASPLNQSNIADFVDVEGLARAMREKMANTMLLSDGGYFLYNGDEFARIDNRGPFASNTGGYKLSDQTQLVKDINGMLDKMPTTQHGSWSWRRFVKERPELYIAERHNGTAFEGQTDIMVVNKEKEPQELDKEALQAICDVTLIADNKHPTIEQLVGGMLHTDSTISIAPDVLQSISAQPQVNDTESHGRIHNTQTQIGE